MLDFVKLNGIPVDQAAAAGKQIRYPTVGDGTRRTAIGSQEQLVNIGLIVAASIKAGYYRVGRPDRIAALSQSEPFPELRECRLRNVDDPVGKIGRGH